MKHYYCALTIAGSDSCGGAGMQADIKTLSALGVYAASVVTAVTVQNTTGVFDVEALRPDIVGGQIRAVMDDIRPTAVKIGMVNDRATIQAIAQTLSAYDLPHLVIDPVMVSTSGSRLMQADALECFCQLLLPMATLLTPNVPEAEILSDSRIRTTHDMDRAAARIASLGCRNLLIKGGHLEGAEKSDRLYTDGHLVAEYKASNVPTRNTHGTGCTLSSAITAGLAQGLPLTEAVSQAKSYLHQALEAGKDIHIGEGYGPVNHFFNPQPLIIHS